MSEHTESKLYLQFGKSSSRNFPEARKLAERFSTYECHNSGKGQTELHEVTFRLTQEDLKLLNSFIKLLQLVHAWKSVVLRLNDEDVPYIYPFLNGLSEVSSCYRTKVHHELMDDYCKGKKAPTDEQTVWGCKYEKGVAILHAGYGGNSIWYQFGKLSEDNKLFYIDKEQIFERLQIATKKEACLLCPDFDWERMRRSLAIIPEIIDIENDNRFEIAYSKIDPTRQIGIQKRPPEFFRLVSNQASNSEANQDRKGETRNVPSVRYTDIAGQQNAIEEIENIIGLPLKYPQYFSAIGVESHKGILLYGPPGNGKTLLAKAVAGEANAHFEIINGPEILSKWVGQSEQNLRRIFEQAKHFAPSIILIDEIDSIAPLRAGNVQHHTISLISQLLVLLDGLKDRGNVTVIASTNRIEAIDPAIRRPGRFDYHIQVGLPDFKGRIAILNVHLSKMKCKVEASINTIANSTDTYSGAELAAICREAGLIAIKRGIRFAIKPDDLFVIDADILSAYEGIREKRFEGERVGEQLRAQDQTRAP